MERDAAARSKRDRELHARASSSPRPPVHARAAGADVVHVDEMPGKDRIRGRTQGAAALSAVIATIVPSTAVHAPRPRTGDRFDELDRLARQLSALLEGAPRTWSKSRRTLWRMIRAARREMRAQERGRTFTPHATNEERHHDTAPSIRGVGQRDRRDHRGPRAPQLEGPSPRAVSDIPNGAT